MMAKWLCGCGGTMKLVCTWADRRKDYACDKCGKVVEIAGKCKRRKGKQITSLDELYDESGNVLCRFCESCDHTDDVEGKCWAEKNPEDRHVLLDAADCDCGELVSKELADLNKRMPMG